MKLLFNYKQNKVVNYVAAVGKNKDKIRFSMGKGYVGVAPARLFEPVPENYEQVPAVVGIETLKQLWSK